MKVKVYHCWSGGSYHWRLYANGHQFRFQSEGTGTWSRAVAKEALDLLEAELQLDRRSVRFIHA